MAHFGSPMGIPNPFNHRMFYSFRVKVTAVAIVALLFMVGLSNLFIYRFSLKSQFEQLRQQLMVIAQTAALVVDADSLMSVPLSRDGIQSRAYRDVAERLKRIKELNPSLKYIYTMKRTARPDVWQFIVDLDPELKYAKKQGVTAYPGDPYNPMRFPEMVQGYDRPSADHHLMEDEWGVTLSGYAPIRDKAGRPVAILGVDMDARDVFLVQRSIHRMALGVLGVGILLSILLGYWLSKRMTDRIAKLIEGTRRIAAGDLDHRAEVKGLDEIGELAASFNQMACQLSESRKQLEEYFCRTVQSLVRILEAKDKYTQGHSERVGVYAQRTALQMGFSEAEADRLKKAGELHDIGKLAIHESILCKNGPLNDEEWEIIRQHPVIGGNALEAIFFNDIVMSGIRSHHERFDGTGYPDQLKGDQTSIFAQIISVADAYDAMTTTRSYRKALDKSYAVQELKKHTGSQFHPRVVEAFLKVIDENQAQAA